jgi:hypothetical protein
MIALDRIRRQGFKIRPTDTGIYIDPIDELKPEQRLWIVNNKPAIHQQLLTEQRLLVERWQWFLSLAKEHGIHPDVVGAEFPTDDDRLDVIEPAEHDDETLQTCMATLCNDVRVRQRQQDYEAGTWVPVYPDGEVMT